MKDFKYNPKKKLFFITVIAIAIIVLILFVLLKTSTTPFHCPEQYHELYKTNQKVNSNEEAYLNIKSFLDNETIETVRRYRRDYLKEKIQNLATEDMEFKKINNKEMWVALGKLAIDREGTIYSRLLCR